MKHMIKKIFAGVLCVAAVLSLTACGGQNKIPTIGINQYGEHSSLDNCREGFLQGLKDAGLEEGVDYQIDYQNAGFDDTIAGQIASSFAAITWRSCAPLQRPRPPRALPPRRTRTSR